MDDLHSEPSAAIKAARRQLESVDGYELLEDLTWNNSIDTWMIKIRLACEVPTNEFIPTTTEWHVAISQHYPDGMIKFYPDKIVGVKATFPHQNYNSETKGQFLSGDPCLNTIQGSWGRKAYSSEPKNSERLLWHLYRCLEWLKAAASNSLFLDGDPFELPPFPSTPPKYILAFNEDHGSFQRWAASDAKSGSLEIKTVGQSPQLYAIFNFLGHEQNPPEFIWGKRIAAVEVEDQTGIWMLAPAIPVLKPWQIPQNMGELVKVLSIQGIDLRQRLSTHYDRVRRKGKEVRMIAIGFPVPEKIGQPDSLIHWSALELPHPPKPTGFRDTEALYRHELNVLTSPDRIIRWINTENWNKSQLTRRGSVAEILLRSNVVVIGCGAVGSILTEQLARLGVDKITVVDPQTATAGNMSRHVLSLIDVGNNKAEALAKRLNSIFPFLNVRFEKEKIQHILSSRPDFLSEYDVVIDATGDDNALKCLSDSISKLEKNFVSISTGYNANKLFCFVYKRAGEISIFDSFTKTIAPWLKAEKELSAASSEVVDGVGCWHPLFPARLDDLQMLIGASVKVIESNLASDANLNLTIIEKQFDEGHRFTGIKIINVP